MLEVDAAAEWMYKAEVVVEEVGRRSRSWRLVEWMLEVDAAVEWI
jgi:hypothetical protein